MVSVSNETWEQLLLEINSQKYTFIKCFGLKDHKAQNYERVWVAGTWTVMFTSKDCQEKLSMLWQGQKSVCMEGG